MQHIQLRFEFLLYSVKTNSLDKHSRFFSDLESGSAFLKYARSCGEREKSFKLFQDLLSSWKCTECYIQNAQSIPTQLQKCCLGSLKKRLISKKNSTTVLHWLTIWTATIVIMKKESCKITVTYFGLWAASVN